MNKAIQALNTKGGAVAVGQAVNPINDENIFYTGVNAIGGYISGEDNWNLGAKIYDWTH